jgi:hypothetical protein
MQGENDTDTPQQRQIVENCLEVAQAWSMGQLPLLEARSLTGDGYIRAKVTARARRYPAFAASWQQFLDALVEYAQGDCDFGGYTHSGMWITKQQVVDHGGWIERESDSETGEVMCRVHFAPVDVDSPPRMDKIHGERPAGMAEWFE